MLVPMYRPRSTSRSRCTLDLIRTHTHTQRPTLHFYMNKKENRESGMTSKLLKTNIVIIIILFIHVRSTSVTSGQVFFNGFQRFFFYRFCPLHHRFYLSTTSTASRGPSVAEFRGLRTRLLGPGLGHGCVILRHSRPAMLDLLLFLDE